MFKISIPRNQNTCQEKLNTSYNMFKTGKTLDSDANSPQVDSQIPYKPSSKSQKGGVEKDGSEMCWKNSFSLKIEGRKTQNSQAFFQKKNKDGEPLEGKVHKHTGEEKETC